MMLRKHGALNNEMLRLGCCLHPYQNSWLCAWLDIGAYIFLQQSLHKIR